MKENQDDMSCAPVIEADRGRPQEAPSPEEIAAKATGLRPDQVLRAIEEYRKAAADVEEEPEWQAQTHMSGPEWGVHTYVAEGTAVMLTIENWKHRGEWKSGRSFSYGGKSYEEWGAARFAELADTTRPAPYLVAALGPSTANIDEERA